MTLESELARIQDTINARRRKVDSTFITIEADLKTRAEAMHMTLDEYRIYLEKKSKENMPPIEIYDSAISKPEDTLNGWDWAAHHYQPTGKWKK